MPPTLTTLLIIFIVCVVLLQIVRAIRLRGVVVSDTSVITNLACIGHLRLLKRLYGTIYVPPAVHREMLAPAPRNRSRGTVRRARWIRRRTVKNQQKVDELLLRYSGGRKALARGEAEAIVLTIELRARLLLIDERRGRTAAQDEGLEITGLLGVLIASKQRGLINHIKPLLDRLINECEFFIGQKLYDDVLQSVGE